MTTSKYNMGADIDGVYFVRLSDGLWVDLTGEDAETFRRREESNRGSGMYDYTLEKMIDAVFKEVAK